MGVLPIKQQITMDNATSVELISFLMKNKTIVLIQIAEIDRKLCSMVHAKTVHNIKHPELVLINVTNLLVWKENTSQKLDNVPHAQNMK